MASFVLAFLFLILHGSSSLSRADPSPYSFRPKALVLPVIKDAATKQYVATIQQRSPLQSEKLVIHLGGKFPWVDCTGYNSTTYRHVRCRSAACNAAKTGGCGSCYGGPFGPTCGNNTCLAFSENPISLSSTHVNLIQDVISLRSTDGRTTGPLVTIPNSIFACGSNIITQELAAGAHGMIGLGQSAISLPTQLATTFSFPKKFAICLSSSSSSPGVIFFGDGPYVFLPGIDFSPSLTYTPILMNPTRMVGIKSPYEWSGDYYIKVSSIRVNGKALPLNIDKQGQGGTKLSTVNQYTTLQSSFYRALEDAFVKEAAAMNITRVKAVHPFNACFSTKNAMQTRVGLWVPAIELVLDKETTVWQIFGVNAVVQLSNEVMCLALLDAGESPRSTIVIGGHQLEGRLVQFDLAGSRMGFSSLLTSSRTSCASFNFGSA